MAIVKKYPARVVAIKQPIEGVYTIDMLSLGKPFNYYPGQFLHLALDEYDPSEGWPDSRCFSMQSPPGDEILRLTFAVKGKFTRRMAEEIFPGKILTLKLPFGNLFQQAHNKENVVFIAGGTGITPFLSLFGFPGFAGYINPIIYLGVRTKKYFLYKPELDTAISINPGLKVNLVFEDVEGKLDIDKIFDHHGRNTTYFISGPPDMINNFNAKLKLEGVAPERIIKDEWE